MRTLSLDLRERILSAYDNHEGTRPEVAHRFRVSLGMVKKLLQQRRRTGDIAPGHRFCGRKPMIVSTHQRQLRALLAINVVLGKMGLTYKKRHSAPASKTGQISPRRVVAGASGRRALTRPS